MKLVFFILVLIVTGNANVNVVCKAGIMDNNNAKTYINKLLEKEPKNIECILKLANIHLKSGDLLRGYELITRAYNANAFAVGQSDISNILTYALKMTKMAKKAKKNNDKFLWNEVGDNFFDMGVYSESIPAYKKSLLIDFKQTDISLKLALSYKKNNQTDNAVEQLENLLQQNKNNFYANYYLGKILRYSSNKEDNAIVHFTQAKEILIASKKDFSSEEYPHFIYDINKELEK